MPADLPPRPPRHGFFELELDASVAASFIGALEVRIVRRGPVSP